MDHLEEFQIMRQVMDRALTKDERAEICAQIGLSQATFYRRRNLVKELPVASSLIPKTPGPLKGSRRLSDLQEMLIEETLDRQYFTKQRLKISKCYLYLIERCERAEIEPPSQSTFRRRVKATDKIRALKGRCYTSERKSKYSPKTKHFVSPKPMQIVEVDHTKLNAIIVSQIDGTVLGRPTYTLLTDIHSRLAVGHYVSLHGPDWENVAKALEHSCFPKDEYLEALGLEGSWPNLGLPDLLLMDNAKEFKGNALGRGCGEYGITQKYRPVKTPHYGGHVESLIDTINVSLHGVPGTTFGSVSEKGDYNSEKLACLTLPDIEKFLLNFIINRYHKNEHSELGVSPLQKYDVALAQGFQPRLPPKPREQFLADFSFSRINRIRDLGLEFECKEYWSPYIQDLYNKGVKNIRILPISNTVKAINVLGPDGKIHEVPAKDLSLPNITRREWKKHRRTIRERNKSRKMTNAEIAHFVRMEDQIISDARRKRKRLRRADESQLERLTDVTHQLPPTVVEQNEEKIQFDPTSLFSTFTSSRARD